MTEGIHDAALHELITRLRARGDEADAQLVEQLGGLEALLRRNQVLLVRLARSEAIGQGHVEAALAEITEAAAELLGVARTSVWRYVDERQSIRCLDLYRTDERMHERDIELSAADYPAYFEALLAERSVAIHHVDGDPRTTELAETYLTPLGIGALLCVPVRVGGRMIGLLCIEQVGGARTWTTSDEQFAGTLADFVALALEAAERRRSEAELREAVALAEQQLQTIERQRLAIADLTAPIIDVWDGILALPIVGLVDTQRSIELTERLLKRISESSARSVIVDLTGVDIVDTMTANHLLQMIRAASLLGTFSVLSGISPHIAKTLVQLDIDLAEITTVRNLKEALKVCLRRTAGMR